MPSTFLRTCRLRIAALATLLASGCAIFEQSGAHSERGSALSWLTSWVSQPLEVAPGFDLEALRPPPREACVEPGDLLEVTVWDLDEPGRPCTYPVRVSEERTIAAPLLGSVSVAGCSLAQAESALRDGYWNGEYLVAPRVLVRSLDPATRTVRVSGAVQRIGFVELSRSDASVHAALVAAGGLRKSAGTQVAVVRRTPSERGERALPAAEHPGEAESSAAALAPRAPEEFANRIEPLAVASGLAEGIGDDPAAGVMAEAIPPEDSADHAPRWYDLARPSDREELRHTQLADGDEVIVKSGHQPLRVGGAVLRPGAYPVPAERGLSVWQAIDLAGGVRAPETPLNITLLRPAAEGRPAQRWSLSVPDYGRHPVASPQIEPGDVLHVEPTAGGRIKRAVGDLWSKP